MEKYSGTTWTRLVLELYSRTSMDPEISQWLVGHGVSFSSLFLTCSFILSSCFFFSCYSLNCTFLFLQLSPPLSRFLSLLLCRVLFCVPVCRSCVMTEFTPDCCHMRSVLMAYTNRNILACMHIKEKKHTIHRSTIKHNMVRKITTQAEGHVISQLREQVNPQTIR